MRNEERGIKLENFIKILKNNGYEVEKISDDFIMIKTKEMLSNGDLIDPYLLKRKDEFFLVDEDSLLELDIKGALEKEEERMNRIAQKYSVTYDQSKIEFYKKTSEETLIDNLKNIINASLEAERGN
jgi:hypothetical protein